MQKKGEGRDRRTSAYWTISRGEIGAPEVLSVTTRGVEAVPVFSFEEEARLFLVCEGLEEDWEVRETTTGQLTLALFGPASRADAVALDPLPTILGEEANLLLSLGREEFARGLRVGRGANVPGRRCRRGPAPNRGTRRGDGR